MATPEVREFLPGLLRREIRGARQRAFFFVWKFVFDFPRLVRTFVQISDNPDVRSLAGFDALAPVDFVSIYNNPNLPQCEVEAILAPGGYCQCFYNDVNATSE